MIRPHTRPSRTRRTAEVDHRGSGTHFVWKNIGLVHLLSLKNAFRARLPSKVHRQLIHPHHLQSHFTFYIAGTILELQITMEFHRQLIHQHRLQPHLQCGNDPTVTNHNGILWTTRGRKTIETPMIRPCSDHDPTTHETVSHPSHRRGRSSRFGDALCMEKHRVSCICYLSKTHFVRNFFKTPSATHPPAPLAIPFTLRERS